MNPGLDLKLNFLNHNQNSHSKVRPCKPIVSCALLQALLVVKLGPEPNVATNPRNPNMECSIWPFSFQKMGTTSFPGTSLKNKRFSRFEKLRFWVPKRWKIYCPFLRPQNVWCKNDSVFFDLWTLSSFLPFPSLKKGVAKKKLVLYVFCHTLFII